MTVRRSFGRAHLQFLAGQSFTPRRSRGQLCGVKPNRDKVAGSVTLSEKSDSRRADASTWIDERRTTNCAKPRDVIFRLPFVVVATCFLRIADHGDEHSLFSFFGALLSVDGGA